MSKIFEMPKLPKIKVRLRRVQFIFKGWSETTH